MYFAAPIVAHPIVPLWQISSQNDISVSQQLTRPNRSFCPTLLEYLSVQSLNLFLKISDGWVVQQHYCCCAKRRRRDNPTGRKDRLRDCLLLVRMIAFRLERSKIEREKYGQRRPGVQEYKKIPFSFLLSFHPATRPPICYDVTEAASSLLHIQSKSISYI